MRGSQTRDATPRRRDQGAAGHLERAGAGLAARPTRRPKPKRRLPPEVLTDEEVRALLDACGRYTPVALRNRALITLMYRAGLRVSEALALAPKDVDLVNGIVRVLHGKGDRYRAVGLDPGAAAVVAAWLAERGRGQRVWGRVAARTNGATDPLAAAPLLCTVYGTPVTTGYVRRLMKRLGRQAGIAKRVHAHGLRHTHAAQLRSEGVDVGIISRQLGHRSLLTTIRYLDHVQPTAVVDAMRERVWATDA
jgi:integrase/recombinase XerD